VLTVVALGSKIKLSPGAGLSISINYAANGSCTAGQGPLCSSLPASRNALGNSSSASGRMLLITAPPGHEKYFDELRDLIAKGGKPDPEALAKLRAKYDTVQLATLTPS
jgi:hypothetical protein